MRLQQTDPRWSEQYAEESARLRTLFGEIPEGGIVENIEHIGTTAVPGALAEPQIDIGLAVWPFPLEPSRRSALEALGYTPVPGYEGAPEQRFRRADGAFELRIVDSGSELWTHYLIIRDYLRHDGAALEAHNRRKQACAETLPDPASYERAKADLLHQTLDAGRRWWVDYHGFAPVHAVVRELEEFPQPWYISSGWALDLFLGRCTRPHTDIDLALFRDDQFHLRRHLPGWSFHKVVDGRLTAWAAEEWLPPPVHEIHAHAPEDQAPTLEFLLNERVGEHWVFRRHPAVRCPVRHVSVRSAAGLPVLCPAVVLLYKAARAGAADELDFRAALGHLAPERRMWLRQALAQAHPEHPWLARL